MIDAARRSSLPEEQYSFSEPSMSQTRTPEEIRHPRVVNKAITALAQATASAVELTPLRDDYLAIVRTSQAWRRLLRWTSSLDT
jgi:hypothetical protein